MNYISSEEFLNQNRKVKNVLFEWWNPQIFDCYSILDKKEIKWVNLNISNIKIKNSDCIKNKNCIPLFQIHQLIEFIEDKTNRKLEIKYNYSYDIYLKNMKYSDRDMNFINLGHNLLQALWKVAIQIAEEQNTIIDDYENFEINIKL